MLFTITFMFFAILAKFKQALGSSILIKETETRALQFSIKMQSKIDKIPKLVQLLQFC